ncbi:patatin-like phospholipase family protein [Clostridium perfringens]|uniref:patatin-like phospholipase family protein n=1 Tax=Clostridium perfringens TaxID=1502 RepID=UPI002ACF0321|nr:patatin family protein [Clostridium perfringens]MDZ7547927.1 patatin family protein [Clostridium perfringens]
MESTSLILEGGGMRGAYTAGVLDLLLDKEIDIKYCIGVSAGACNCVSYISKQHKRNYRVNINYVNDKRYLSFNNLIKTGSAFGMDMLFDIIPNQLEPFDYEKFKSSGVKFLVGATNCETGKPEFYNIKDVSDGYDALKASISLPLVAKIIEFDNKKLLDGGIAAPIPIQKAIDDGIEKHVVILTQHKGYTKSKTKMMSIIKRKYKKHPALIDVMENRYRIYNDTLEKLDKLEQEGKCFVIRPSSPLDVSRFERNKDKLEAIYNKGYEDAEKLSEELIKFL